MPEKMGSAEGDLALRALLYAGAELSGEESDAFERLLGRDQAAREALTQAVQMTLALGPPPRPDPAYRARARARLRPSWWHRLTGPRTYRGHPLLWTALGAAAAALLALRLGGPSPADPPAPNEMVVVVPVPVPTGPAAPADSPGVARAVADHWADINNHDHLSRALADEQRRRDRLEDRLTRAEERRLRKPGQGTDRQ